MKIVECIPNFSEGRRPEVVARIRDAIAAVDGVAVLDVASDASHNRTVVTFVAPLDRAVEAQLAGIRAAREHIDLNHHTGEHPRMGAADVVPFVPLEGATMEDCIALARQLGERVGRELEIPVYLYERAATTPARENLADVRRGEFEGLREEIGRVPARDPDFGPKRIHPTAGAVAVGARPFLVAYNVYLGPAANLPVAKRVAAAVRGSSGGLRHVKALGLEVDGQAQVSMNLVDVEKTPLHRAFEMVRTEALGWGVAPTWSEVVGLVPERALIDAGVRHVQLDRFTPDMVLERRVRQAIGGGESVSAFVASVAAPTPTPGGGTVAAHVGSLAAALAQMVAGLTVGKKKYAAVEGAMKELGIRAAALANELAALAKADAESYAAVSTAYKLPKEPPAAADTRQAAIAGALLGASEVPLRTARAAAEVARLAADAAEQGNQNAVSDAGVAALLAEAACRGAAYNVRINVAGMDDKGPGMPLVEEARRLVEAASRDASRAAAAVERAIGM
ncbi:MAG TPA: glutamate formimidoyltransferase [Gemmatimonadaceae bacterium]|nr:glutamate formimidoyltransferase [Gemmatimonadaceae bacterium]